MEKGLYDLIHPQDPQAVEREVTEPLTMLDPGFNAERLKRTYHDVVRLFRGEYPGYRASDAWYHDLEHTNTVFLCVAAMLVGAHHQGIPISARGKLLGLHGALFHDVGLIRRIEETEGTGARYTVGHEDRSVSFMRHYFAAHGFEPEDVIDTRHIIRATVLGQQIADIPFRSEEIRALGRMVGSADIIAQMADRAYLEKLLLLFREFQEAHIPGYNSELELLEKTPGFYRSVVKHRLEGEFEHADALLETNARVRWGVDDEPFHRSIERNLQYLHTILSDKPHYRQRLRRRGIVARLPERRDEEAGRHSAS